MRACRPATLHSLGTLLAAASFALATAATTCIAHTLPVSFLAIVPDESLLHLELTFNPFELNVFGEMDANRDARLGQDELSAHEAALTRKIAGCIEVTQSGRPVAATVAGITPDIDTHHLAFRAHYPIDQAAGRLTVRSTLASITSGAHVTEVTCLHPKGTLRARFDQHSSILALPDPGDLVLPEPPRSPRTSAARPLWRIAALGAAAFALLGVFGVGVARLRGIATRKPATSNPE